MFHNKVIGGAGTRIRRLADNADLCFQQNRTNAGMKYLRQINLPVVKLFLASLACEKGKTAFASHHIRKAAEELRKNAENSDKEMMQISNTIDIRLLQTTRLRSYRKHYCLGTICLKAAAASDTAIQENIQKLLNTKSRLYSEEAIKQYKLALKYYPTPYGIPFIQFANSIRLHTAISFALQGDVDKAIDTFGLENKKIISAYRLLYLDRISREVDDDLFVATMEKISSIRL